ncbi:MAG: CHAD domain-containing protein, partial [Solirubrobacterales bacterium]
MRARKVKRLDPRTALAENAARIIRVRLDELRSFAPEALEADNADAMHDMRIAAKRLRYVLEATGFCFGRAGATARRRAKEVQDLLGEIHDADVMVPRLREHRAELRQEDAATVRGRAGAAEDLDPELAARAPHRTAYRGLEVLEVYLLARRALLAERFVALWSESENRGVWSALELVAQEELDRVAEL